MIKLLCVVALVLAFVSISRAQGGHPPVPDIAVAR